MSADDAKWVPNDLFFCGEPETCPKCDQQTELLQDAEMTYGERCCPCGWTNMFSGLEGDNESDHALDQRGA